VWCWSEVAHAALMGERETEKEGEREKERERERERERGRWNRACRLGLFSHPLMKRTASPQGLLEFLASVRMWDICPSVTLQHTNTHTHAHSFFLSLSLSLPVFLCHTSTHHYTLTELHILCYALQAHSDELICQVSCTEIKDDSGFLQMGPYCHSLYSPKQSLRSENKETGGQMIRQVVNQSIV